MVRQRWDNVETIATKLRQWHLEWLAYVARMTEYSLATLNLSVWVAGSSVTYPWP